MEKYVKRKNLTPEQLAMANKTMAIILAVCYIAYIVTELSNQASGEGAPFWQVRCGVFAILGIVDVVQGLYFDFLRRNNMSTGNESMFSVYFNLRSRLKVTM